MDTTPLMNLEPIAKHLKLPLASVQQTAELIEEGNTVPFITRFRKDQTGGLDEQQVRAIEKEINRVKLLSERKETILKSIDSREQLTAPLADQIKAARTLRAVEDIYLPYKPKKQSLAALARSRGLEPLALEILDGKIEPAALQSRAEELVDVEKELPEVESVWDGIRHLVAEHFGNSAKLRAQVRRQLWRQGKLVSRKTDEPQQDDADDADDAAADENNAELTHSEEPQPQSSVGESAESTSGDESTENPNGVQPATSDSLSSSEATDAEVTDVESTNVDATTVDAEAKPDSPIAAVDEAVPDGGSSGSDVNATEVGETKSPPATAGSQATDAQPVAIHKASDPPATLGATPTGGKDGDSKKKTVSRRDQRRETRRRRRDRLVQSFKDYFDFSDPIGKIPHHRILAINRGERTKVLRVKVECHDWDKFQAEIEKEFVPPDHAHVDFLRKCWQDAMSRLLVPSIEREVRRELNEKAEEHAVKVFARNLRKLLLQPPLHQHRVVSIDPGFRSGCKLIALDEFGQVLGHTFINLVGNDRQKQTGREGLVKFVLEHKATVIAIGNGTACRETESLVAEVLSRELENHDVAYLIVNEAGTSVYSTSELGREELPQYDATVRGAVSIGRRSLDPLSELVKIDPASIGVGLYQHDVKAKHLRESLDAVVESCVNYVGVDVNSASPALLRYVSGLNSLTARRIYEHRQKNGPFRHREQLKAVSGIGESTYVQAAGFLKIANAENPLDGTWIHPESYPVATKVLDAIGFGVNDLDDGESPPVAVRTDAIAEPRAFAPLQDALASEVMVAEVPAAAPTEPTAGDPNTADSATVEATTEIVPEAVVPPEATPVTPAATDAAPFPLEDTALVAEIAPLASAPTTDISVSVGMPIAEAADGCAAPSTSTSTTPVPKSASHAGKSKELADKLASIEVDQLSTQLGVGKLLLKDILKALARPGRDPREDLPPPIFRRGILKLEDLKPEMELAGTVLNVVDFGAFVDIGLVDSGLVHVSRLADKFVSDPHDVVSVGDILRVWVVEVDQKRRRVSLTAIEPGTAKSRPEKGEKPTRPPRSRKGQGGKETGRATGKGRQQQGRRPPRGRGQKPTEYKPKPKPKPKPVVPITKEMEEGSEPLRTFGDLKQLFDKRKREK